MTAARVRKPQIKSRRSEIERRVSQCSLECSCCDCLVQTLRRAGGDLFPDRAAAIQKLADASRYKITFNWFWKEFFRFGDWLLLPATVVIPLLYIPANKSDQTRARQGFQTAIVAIGLTLAGYFAIYVITPHDLYWHLRNSLGRLFLQVWPSAIFMFFSALPTEAKYSAQSQPVSK